MPYTTATDKSLDYGLYMAKRIVTVQTDRSAMLHVREQFNRMNWEANPVEADFGWDLHVKVFDRETERGTPWELKVQVKGTRSPKIKRDTIHFPIDAAHVSDWVNSGLPVLFVICHVARPVRAYFQWVDHFVYKDLQWPIADDSFVLPKTVSLRLPLTNHLGARCAGALLQYVRQWSPTSRTATAIAEYLSRVSKSVENAHRKRGIPSVFKWDLFLLPIKYRRRARTRKPWRVTGYEQLLAQGERCICLLGKPATGKTVTVDRICARPPGMLVPVHIAEILPSDKDGLCDHISRTIGAARSHVEYLESQRRLLLVVDGLSECHDYAATATSIAGLTSAMPNTRFLVTCRTADYQLMGRVDGFDEWEIAGLDRKSQDRFLEQQDRDVQRSLTRAFEEQPLLRTWCANQFLFLIAVQEIPRLDGGRLSRARLYKSFLTRYLRWIGAESARGPDQMIDLLSRIAFAMRKSLHHRTSLTEESLDRLLVDFAGRHHAAQLKTALLRHGLIERTGRGVRFFQETLHLRVFA